MALDTQQKRMSAASTMRPWIRAQFPSSPVTEIWRVSIGNAYGGNTFQQPPTSGAIVSGGLVQHDLVNSGVSD